jgi:hypothetical protein
MANCGGRRVPAAIALLACAVLLGAPLPACADPALPAPGYFDFDEGAAAAAAAGKPAPRHLYMFGVPYIMQDPAVPETFTPPQTINGTALSSNENVLGWGDLSIAPGGAGNISGVTFTSSRNGALIDADTTYSSLLVTSTSVLRRVAVHELGHALGLAHSNVEGQVMSGPGGSGNPGVPDTQYVGISDLQPDDIQGCLCLYGPSAANAGKGYLCDLPTYRDFGSVPVGGASPTQSVTLRNAATSGSVAVGPITFTSAEFQTVSGCAPGTVLGPGASCTMGVVFRPVGGPGPREAYIEIAGDSLGPYAVPLMGNATASTGTPRNYQGLWWGAPPGSESGWGINFAHQGDTLFATWFTFDADGSPLWMVAAAPKTGSDTYAGTLYRGTGPAFSAAAFDPAKVVGKIAGTVSFTFTDANNATFTYAVNGVTQTKPITRQVFASPVPTCTWGGPPSAAAATNYQDLWWASPPGSESGWGIYLTHQGDTIFATWFTFGAAGQPLWLTVSAAQTSPKVYSGTLYTGTGPAFDAVPFDPSKVIAAPAGVATLGFSDGNNALFTYSIGSISQSKPITRQVFNVQDTTCQ